jgi:hypothetical protein
MQILHCVPSSSSFSRGKQKYVVDVWKLNEDQGRRRNKEMKVT